MLQLRWRRILLTCFIYPRFYRPRYGTFLSVSLYKDFIIHHSIPGILKLFSFSGDTFQVPPWKGFIATPLKQMPKHILQPQTLYRPTSNPESQCPDACSSIFPRSPKGMCQCWRSFSTFNPVLMMASVVQKVKYCVMSQNNSKQTKPTKPTPPSKKP